MNRWLIRPHRGVWLLTGPLCGPRGLLHTEQANAFLAGEERARKLGGRVIILDASGRTVHSELFRVDPPLSNSDCVMGKTIQRK